jgi:thioredoxin-like negative regulator of GroEL
MFWERLAITLLLTLFGLLAYAKIRKAHLRQLGRIITDPGQATLLYFASESCAACPTQMRYLDQLTELWNGRLAIRKIDADVEPEKAAEYRVFTLPTTILIDEAGKVREVNYGLTNPTRLSRQLESWA